MLQEPRKKLKLHDKYDDMAQFSQVWKRYPVLYDEAECNRRFSTDFKGTGAYIRSCYENMGRELGLTWEEVRKRRIKYTDAVMKALSQLKQDLQHNTKNLPVPAVHKLRLFRWLWPFSKNFDKDSMEEVSFDGYMERALVTEVNKLVREEKDATAAHDTLRKVQELNAHNALKALNLKCTSEETENDVCLEELSSLPQVAEVEECSAMWSICAYLPPSRDPTFHYAEAGFALFEAVSVTDTAWGGKVCVNILMDCLLN